MKIFTLTLNPAFDIHLSADGFLPYGESEVKICSTDAGGKGINISRALAANGTESRAIAVLGTENGDEFCRMLKADSLAVIPVFRNGRIRENLTLHERENPETRISFGGFAVDKSVLAEVEAALGVPCADMIITLTGSIPSGISTNDVLDMLVPYKKAGAKIVIDSRSVSLCELVKFAPWLIKPNSDEIRKYTDRQITNPADAARVASELRSAGIENVMISLGAEGAVLACEAGRFYADTPKIEAISTVGAGDSAIAGFIVGTLASLPYEKRLARAVAFGTAACMREGTLPPTPADVSLIEGKIRIQPI